MGNSSKKEISDLIDWAVTGGFTYDGYDGRGHHVLTWRDGSSARVPATPGGANSIPNARAAIRRVAGWKSDAPKRNKKSAPRKRAPAPHEQRAAALHARLDKRRDELCDAIAEYRTSPTALLGQRIRNLRARIDNEIA